MNEHDSEKLAGMLGEMGYSEALSKDSANVIIINTCSIREHADEKFFGFLGQLKKIKTLNPDTVISVCGCMMQQEHVIERIKTKYPFVDLIFGTHNIHNFPSMLSDIINDKSKLMEIWDENGEMIEGIPSKRKYEFKAFVNVMNGCNNYCTYCVVPYTRGRERSRDPKEILSEVRDLGRNGVKEITLLGQNVNSFGNGTDNQTSFTDLIYQINEIEQIKRIRFMTSHPKDLSMELIKAYKDCQNLCNHIHLPVQSGSSKVLEDMNRHYTKEQYIKLTERLRSQIPDMSITTDIIVGFPGETEDDFNETMDLAEKVNFDFAYTFLYSMRKGTPAHDYKNQVPEEIKHQRFNRLVELLNRIADIKNKSCIGNISTVLVEGPSKTNKSIYTGRTESFKPVNFSADPSDVGNIIPIMITGAKTFSLFGKKI